MILQKNDLIIDLSLGLSRPTMLFVAEVSKSWFRRRKPYRMVRTHDKGMLCAKAIYIWFPQSIVDETLKHPKVKVMRNQVQVWPKVQNG